MKRFRYRAAALLLGLFTALSPAVQVFDGSGIHVVKAEEMAAYVSGTNVNMRTGPGTDNTAIGRLSQGTLVTILGQESGTDGNLWYKIRCGTAEGYVSSAYIAVGTPAAVPSDENFEALLAEQGFPESYKPGLRELHAAHPNWHFKAYHTGIDWETAVKEECVIGRNLVARGSISSWKSTADGAYDWNTGVWPGFDGDAWVAASESLVSYFMDPRNFLNEKTVFQFMNQSYNQGLHTREGLQSMVQDTFLSGMAPIYGQGQSTTTGSSGTGPAGPGMDASQSAGIVVVPGAPGENYADGSDVTSEGIPGGNTGSAVIAPGADSYVSEGTTTTTAQAFRQEGYQDIIMDAAAASGVSPYIIAAMIIQEQGSGGTGKSISAREPGYEGYYNFFNIEAYQSDGMTAVQRGLWYASQSGSYDRPWNSARKAIVGGAQWYGEGYLQKGQDTLYLKKFNMTSNNRYKHQYMTNVEGAADEAVSFSKIPALMSASVDFSIPVYKNMPAAPCIRPVGDGSPNNKLGGLGVAGFALTPTFQRDTMSYDLIVDDSVTEVTIEAAALDASATIAGIGPINLQSGINAIPVIVTAGNGTSRTYVINVVRRQNGPTYSESIGSGVASVVNSRGSGPAASGPAASGGQSSQTNVVIIPAGGISDSTAPPSGQDSTSAESTRKVQESKASGTKAAETSAPETTAAETTAAETAGVPAMDSTGETADASASRKSAPVTPTEADSSALTKPYAAASVNQVEAGSQNSAGTGSRKADETRVKVIGTDPPGSGQVSQTETASVQDSGRAGGVQSVSAPGQ
ncbi:MAG: SH3 domain-containing protein [Clostridium sp.]|nr:SH3 domain-containing protein [Clostridium sp.]